MLFNNNISKTRGQEVEMTWKRRRYYDHWQVVEQVALAYPRELPLIPV